MIRRKPSHLLAWSLAFIAVLGFAFAASAAPKKPATTTAAQPAAPTATQPMQMFRCECVVQGTPVEFPDDIYLRNTGTATITKGTVLHWSIPGTNRQGDYKVAADLTAGKGVTVAGVLPGGAAAGTKCDVTKKETVTMQAVPRQPMHVMYSFGCVVQGTPVEFPDDIYLSNKGSATVKKGTKVHWVIPGTNRMGDYTLAEDMLAGKGVMLSGVLPGGVSAGTACTATAK